ncbi:GNAT family N-acetyltransferase [Verrucomicrobiales bacterium BCK34]|nr:GNAT family N-acetyltransferase [Verrucomicrobiales bacterium BCK34]
MPFKQIVQKAIRRCVWGRGLLDLSRISRNFPAAIIRRYRETDLEVCRQIYLLNDNGQFPENCVQRFEDNLQNDETLTLVLELEGRVIGSGGISLHEYSDEIEVAVISFGFLHPRYHEQGYGMLMLAYRLSLLSVERGMWIVSMTSAGNGTEEFFKNLGFQFVETSEVESGLELDYYYLRLPASDIERIRTRISDSPVRIEVDARCPIPSSDKRKEYEELLARENDSQES